MAVLVLAQHHNQTLDKATLHAVTAATKLQPDQVDLLVAGQGCGGVAQAAAKVAGVRRVLHVDAEAYAHPVAEEIAGLILSVADGYDYLLAPSTTTGKNVMPRVAALMDALSCSAITRAVIRSPWLRS